MEDQIKTKRKKIPLLIVFTVITGIVATIMLISFFKTLIPELRELSDDFYRVVDNAIVPDNVSKDTLFDKIKIFKQIESDDVDEWNKNFLEKIATNTNEENNYNMHKHIYFNLAPLNCDTYLQLRGNLDVDVNDNVSHGIISVEIRDFSNTIDVDGDVEKEYEFYQMLNDDGRVATYINNDGTWYVYYSKDNEHDSVTITPKEAAEIYTSGEPSFDGYPTKSNDFIGVTIAFDSTNAHGMHDVLSPNYYGDPLVIFAHPDYTFRGVSFLGVEVDCDALFEMYEKANDPLLKNLTNRYRIGNAGGSIAFESYGEVNDIVIPDDVISSAIEIGSLYFINDYIQETLHGVVVERGDYNE
jgi:hypothetical protein